VRRWRGGRRRRRERLSLPRVGVGDKIQTPENEVVALGRIDRLNLNQDGLLEVDLFPYVADRDLDEVVSRS